MRNRHPSSPWVLALFPVLLAACVRPAPQGAPATAEAAVVDLARLRSDVEWLADPAREGRRAGEPGERAAGDWIAARFAELGLEPAGASGWFHSVDVPLPPRDGGGSRLAATGALGQSVVGAAPAVAPISVSAGGEAEGELVFAGFGLDAPGQGVDEFQGLDLTDKVVLMAAGAPRGAGGEPMVFGGAESSFRKAMAAKRRGARAVLLGPHPARRGEPLPAFGSGPTSLSTLPALFVSFDLAESLWPGYGAHLEDFEASVAAGAPSVAPAPAQGGMRVLVRADVERNRGMARNVLARLRGADPAAPLVLVGAHYDHLGHGETGSLAPDQIGTIHPGADDNGSGTAAVLEAARYLAQRGARGDVLFALWSGEELGLLGSKRWVAEHPKVLESLALALNLDMVGRAGNGVLTLLAAGSSPAFEGALPSIGLGRGLELRLEASGRAVGGSDHQSFLERRIPALHLFSGLHGDYHRPSDTADRVQYDGLVRVTYLTADLVDFAHQAPALPFAEVTAPADPGRARGNDWRVWFGSIPEYGDNGPGLLISGTSPGSPAERAGLLGGDRILEVGETRIEGMADFMVMLSVHKPGETVRVVFERDGERQELLLTLAAREPQ